MPGASNAVWPQSGYALGSLVVASLQRYVCLPPQRLLHITLATSGSVTLVPTGVRNILALRAEYTLKE